MATGVGCVFPEHFTYQYIEAVDDSPAQDIRQHFDGALNFMRNAVEKGGKVRKIILENYYIRTYEHLCDYWAHFKLLIKVLVHCNIGVSRSATLVIAYIMKYEGKTFKESFLQVQSGRYFISPNEGFVAQLRQFEEELKAQK